MGFFFYLVYGLFMFVALILVLLVLIQKGRGGGLASAFGGGSGNTAFGSKTGDVLTWATSVVFGVFLLLAIALNLVANRLHAATIESAPPPVAIPTPAAPAQLPTASPSSASDAAQPVESRTAPATAPGN